MSWRALLDPIPKDASLRSTLSDLSMATARPTSRRERAARLRELGKRPADCPRCGGLATEEECVTARPNAPARIQTILRCQEKECGACVLTEREESVSMPKICARPGCREEFEPSRSHQRFCSASCRNYMNNHRFRREEEAPPPAETREPSAGPRPNGVVTREEPAVPPGISLLDLARRLVELSQEEFDAVMALAAAQRRREAGTPHSAQR